MKNYYWKGVNQAGEHLSGEKEAASVLMLKVSLRKQQIKPLKISEKRKPLFKKRPKKICSQDITLFSRQIATMLNSGIPLVQALTLLIQTQTHMRTLLSHIKTDLESGSTLAEALQRHPKYFNGLFYHLIYAGEQSGTLDTLLLRIASYREKMASLKAKIKKALFYPAAVIFVAILVTAILLIFVVPQFETLFKSFGAELPALTQGIIYTSRFITRYGWIGIFIVLACGIGSYFLYRRHTGFIQWTDQTLLRIPVIGNILKKAIIARFARTFSTTFAAGLPLVDALQSAAHITHNIIFTKAILSVKSHISTGQSLQYALQTNPLFPPMIIQMVAIGEESGTLDIMLNKAADIYEEEVDRAVDTLSSSIEPAILIILGVLVGGLVIAIYLPIFQLGNVI